ncbi:MAG: molecular chaperone DnaJ, partial [Pseudomonadota bacterium]
MLTWFLIGLVLLGVVVFLLKGFLVADPKVLARGLVWTASGILGVLFLYLAVTGRLSWLFIAIPALLPWVLRARMLARMMKTFARMRGASAGQGSGQTSRVESRYLRMTLDHDSGEMDGEVIAGPGAGRRLSEMSPSDLIELLIALDAEDPPSARLLGAYLDRMRAGWRDAAPGRAAGARVSEDAGGFAPGAMSRDEALRIL